MEDTIFDKFMNCDRTLDGRPNRKFCSATCKCKNILIMNDVPFFGDYGFVPPPVPPTPSTLSNQSSDSPSNIGWIFFLLIMILGFVTLVIYYFTKQKTNDGMYSNPSNYLSQKPQNDLNSRDGRTRWITPGGRIFYGD